MTRRTHHHVPTTISELTAILADYDSGCDPEFDFWHEELERQFAEHRLQLADQ